MAGPKAQLDQLKARMVAEVAAANTAHAEKLREIIARYELGMAAAVRQAKMKPSFTPSRVKANGSEVSVSFGLYHANRPGGIWDRLGTSD